MTVTAPSPTAPKAPLSRGFGVKGRRAPVRSLLRSISKRSKGRPGTNWVPISIGGLRERCLQQISASRCERCQDPLPVSTGRDDAGAPQQPKLLRGRTEALVDDGREVAYSQLASVIERREQFEPVGISESRHLGGNAVGASARWDRPANSEHVV